jgi:hypothetical protein
LQKCFGAYGTLIIAKLRDFYMSYMLHVGVMSSSVKLPHFLCCRGLRRELPEQRVESLLESTRWRWRRKTQEASCNGVSVFEQQRRTKRHAAGSNEENAIL